MKLYPFKTAYRYESNNMGIPRNATAYDVVKFEEDELGNDNKINENDLEELKKHPATAVTWVCPKKADAMYYGQAEPYFVPPGTKIIGQDEQGGYMILLPERKEFVYECPHNHGWRVPALQSKAKKINCPIHNTKMKFIRMGTYR